MLYSLVETRAAGMARALHVLFLSRCDLGGVVTSDLFMFVSCYIPLVVRRAAAMVRALHVLFPSDMKLCAISVSILTCLRCWDVFGVQGLHIVVSRRWRSV